MICPTMVTLVVFTGVAYISVYGVCTTSQGHIFVILPPLLAINWDDELIDTTITENIKTHFLCLLVMTVLLID